MFRSTAAALAGDDKGHAAQTERAAPPVDAGLNEIAADARRGDPFALRKFLNAAAPMVRRICRGILCREDPDLEDAIQECLIDVARALSRFRFESDVSHYVTKIAVRRAIAVRRRARARSKQQATLDPSLLAAAGASPDARAGLVRWLLDELNEAQASALLLRVMLGHSIEEIAAITGVSVNTVKTRLRLGKTQLRRWLERRGEGRRAAE